MDNENLKYNFKLGADFVPHIALERCLTEAYQGSSAFRGLPLKFYFSDNKIPSEVNDLDINFHKVIRDSSGFWPISILYNQPSYEFKGFNNNLGRSNKEDIRHSVDIIKSLGFNMYVRNNSTLGFPAYFIIIPGMSQTTRHKNRYELLHKKDLKFLGNIKKLGQINKQEAKELIEAIDHVMSVDLYAGQTNFLREYLLYNSDEYLSNIDINLLMFLLLFFSDEYSNAKKYIDKFLIDKSIEYSYYFAISEYINLKHIKKFNEAEVQHLLSSMYGKKIADEVISDMSDPGKVFQYHDLPTCFNCEQCKVSKTCRFFEIVRIQQLINKIAEENYIEQSDVKNIFKT